MNDKNPTLEKDPKKLRRIERAPHIDQAFMSSRSWYKRLFFKMIERAGRGDSGARGTLGAVIAARRT